MGALPSSNEWPVELAQKHHREGKALTGVSLFGDLGFQRLYDAERLRLEEQDKAGAAAGGHGPGATWPMEDAEFRALTDRQAEAAETLRAAAYGVNLARQAVRRAKESLEHQQAAEEAAMAFYTEAQATMRKVLGA